MATTAKPEQPKGQNLADGVGKNCPIRRVYKESGMVCLETRRDKVYLTGEEAVKLGYALCAVSVSTPRI